MSCWLRNHGQCIVRLYCIDLSKRNRSDIGPLSSDETRKRKFDSRIVKPAPVRLELRSPFICRLSKIIFWLTVEWNQNYNIRFILWRELSRSRQHCTVLQYFCKYPDKAIVLVRPCLYPCPQWLHLHCIHDCFFHRLL
jgi:hypothetical protein